MENKSPVYYIGNDSLKIKLRSGSIEGIYADNGKCLCELNFSGEVEDEYFSKGELETLIIAEKRNQVLDEEIRFFDYSDPKMPVFIRSISAMHRGSFKIKIPNNLLTSYADPYRVEKNAIKCLIITDPNTGKRLYIGLVGNFRYLPHTKTLLFEFGYADLIFSYGRPDEAIFNLRSAYKRLEYEDPLEETPQNAMFIRSRKRAADSRMLLRSKKAGIVEQEEILKQIINYFSDLADSLSESTGAITPEPDKKLQRTDIILKAAVPLYIIGRKDAAVKILKFAASLDKKYQSIPLFANTKTGMGESDKLGFSSDLAFIKAWCLIAETDDGENLFPVAEKCFERLSVKAVNGMLPFTGFEDCFAHESEEISPTIRFHGSLENTVRYLDVLLDYNKHTKNRQRTEAELSGVRKSIKENFFGSDGIYLNAPIREKSIKHPHTIYGKCDICHIKKIEKWSLESPLSIGWLERSPKGFYACVDCLSEAPLSKHFVKETLYEKDIKPLLMLYYTREDVVNRLKLKEFLAKQLSENSELTFSERAFALGFLFDNSADLYYKTLLTLLTEIRTAELRFEDLIYLLDGSSRCTKKNGKTAVI